MLDKKTIIKNIKKELGGSVSYFDIFSVVNILIDEFKYEIATKKNILIPNFGKFSLKTFKPKIIKNVRNGNLQLTKAYTALRFTISRNIVRRIIKTEPCEKNAIK